MDRAIREGPIVNIDETTVQVLQEPGVRHAEILHVDLSRRRPRAARVALPVSSPRAGSVPLSFLEDFKGYIQTDGYNATTLGPKTRHCHGGLLAHARRKFHEVLQAPVPRWPNESWPLKRPWSSSPGATDRKRGPCQRAFCAGTLRASPAAGQTGLEEFKRWLHEKAPLTPPGGYWARRIAYTLNQWSRLIAYLQDGRLRPDNNLVENAIRPFVVGRKNWLFLWYPRGAEASAFLYSLIETAKSNGLKPYAYMRYLFDQLPLAKPKTTTATCYRQLDASRLNPPRRSADKLPLTFEMIHFRIRTKSFAKETGP